MGGKMKPLGHIFHPIFNPNYLKFGGPGDSPRLQNPPGRTLDASWAAMWPGGAGDGNFLVVLGAF